MGMRKWKWFLWFIIAITILGLVICAVFSTLVLTQREIYHNVYVEHVNVGSLSREEAMQKIEIIFENELKERRIRFFYNKHEWEFTYEKLGYSYLYENAIENAYKIGRQGDLFSRAKKINSLRKKPTRIVLEGYFNYGSINEIILQIEEVVKSEEVDASIRRENGIFVITNEILGTRLDHNLLRVRVEEAIKNYKLQDIEIPIKYISPRLTREKLFVVQNIIGEYTTEFDSSVIGRSKNIQLASSSIDGTLLMLGEALSFNKQTGRRTAKAGYQVAPVILNGELVPAIGGGICQVSSTLYAAVLRADLEVIQRQNHSMPVSYMHIGQDATVSYGFIDFEFVNNREYPVFLESYVDGNKLVVRFHGKKDTNIYPEFDTLSMEKHV